MKTILQKESCIFFKKKSTKMTHWSIYLDIQSHLFALQAGLHGNLRYEIGHLLDISTASDHKQQEYYHPHCRRIPNVDRYIHVYLNKALIQKNEILNTSIEM